MKISVVIPAYNSEKWISRTIESVLKQSRPADEVIVIDDGSTDDTAGIVRSFGDKVILIQQENTGAGAARNAGIEAADGDWIAFLDSDDEWMPDYLKRQTELLERNPDLVWSTANYLMCHCTDTICLESVSVEKGIELLKGRHYFEDYFQAFLHHARGCTDTMLVKKQVLIEVGCFEPSILTGQDLDLWWRIAYVYPPIGYLPEPLAIYHIQVPESVTKTYRDSQYLQNLLSRHLALATELNCLERFEPCAQRMLKFYLNKYLHDDRVRSIPVLLNKFGSLLPRRSRIILRAMSLWPQATAFCMPFISRVNKHLGLRI